MQKDPFVIAFAVVNQGEGPGFVEAAIEYGIRGGVVSQAHGLLSDESVDVYAIGHNQREVVYMNERRSVLLPALDELGDRFSFSQTNKGVAFVTEPFVELSDEEGYSKLTSNFQMLFMTVPHEEASKYIEKLNQLGARGATLFQGRGYYEDKAEEFFGQKIVPNKDTLITIVPTDRVQEITKALDDAFSFSSHRYRWVAGLDIKSFSRDKDRPESYEATSTYEALFSVVDYELEDSYVELLKGLHLSGGTSIYGQGTLEPDRAREMFSLDYNPQRKIFITVDKADKIQELYNGILAEQSMDTGVYFTVSISEVYGLYEDN